MTVPRSPGSRADAIGEEGMSPLTPTRIVSLFLGVTGALTLGFLLGLVLPRRQAQDRAAPHGVVRTDTQTEPAP